MASSSAVVPIGADLFIDLFSAHREAYVLDSGEHVNQPLTVDVVLWAWREGHAISGYTAHLDDPETTTTVVGVVDLDEGGLDEGKKVREVLRQHGIPSLLVASRRGCHVWTWHHDEDYHPMPAPVVHRALTHAVSLAGLEGPKAEVFPKPSTSRFGCGAVRMPLFRHPKTGLVYPAYSMENEEVTKVPDLINVVADYTAPHAAVDRLAKEHKAPVRYPHPPMAFMTPRARFSGAPGVSEQLQAMGVQARPGHTTRCPFHGDQHGSLSVSLDDERAWCKAPHCDLYNDGRGMGSYVLSQYISQRA